LKKIDPRKTHFEKNFDQHFGLISDNLIQALHLKVQTIILLQKLCIFQKRKFSKVTSKMQASVVNEAPGPNHQSCFVHIKRMI
jgi:hypothetical protein